MDPLPNEDAERLQLMHRRAIAGAQNLKGNADFAALWDYLDWRYPILAPSFVAGHEGNTHLAAIRDGEKNVMRTIEALRCAPTERDYELGDASPKPTTAETETTPTP